MGILKQLVQQGFEASQQQRRPDDYDQSCSYDQQRGNGRRDGPVWRDAYDRRRDYDGPSNYYDQRDNYSAPSDFDEPPQYDEYDRRGNYGHPSTYDRSPETEYTIAHSPQPTQSAFAPVDGPLPLPVIIPPQRPGSISRGFVAAYAPSLEACGIDQMTFLRFLDDVNDGFKGNKALAGLQVVCVGVGFAPSPIAMGVSMAVSAGAGVANTYHVQHKTNIALDKYNAELFSPRGLFAMIMKYEPVLGGGGKEKGARIKQLGGMAAKLANGRAGSGGDSTWTKDYTSGTSKGAESLPTQAAPMVYMQDRREHKESLSSFSSSSKEQAATGNANSASKAFDSINNFFDKRARARYDSENGNNVLSVPQSGEGSNSRYSTSNLPPTDRGLLGLAANRKAYRQRGNSSRNDKERAKCERDWANEREKILSDRRGRRETEDKLRELDEEYREKMADLEENGEEGKRNERKITKDIYYLMVVNRPSDAQLRAAQSQLDQAPVAMETVI